jgi:hypothetical protein
LLSHTNLNVSPNIIRDIKSRKIWTGYVACKGKMRKAYNILVGKPEGKRPLRKPRCRWEDNIRIGKQGERVVAAFIWLLIRSSGRLL